MSEQLPLPFAGALARSSSSGIPRNRRIWVNRNLAMSDIDWIGFDMDYTLAIYDQQEMDRLSFEVTALRLVARGYPAWLQEIAWDASFPIRGLLIDKKLGHVVKMDRYKAVGKAFRGLRALTRDQIRAAYHASKPKTPLARYHYIDTLYALSEATMFAQIIEAYDSRAIAIDHAQLFADIREGIDEAHRDGTIFKAITSDLPRYLRRDDALAATLHKMRSAGKRTFVLTNSRRPYTEIVMNYLLGSASAEYPSWRHYFDVIVVAASKPSFFRERQPFLERSFEDRDDSPTRIAHAFERGRIYEGGNIIDLERMLGSGGDRLLYVGDHIYGDIVRSKRESAWRTAMIIQEMDVEVAAHAASAADLHAYQELEDRRARLEDDLRFLQSRFKDVQRQLEGEGSKSLSPSARTELDAERTRTKRAVERVRGMLRGVESSSRELEAKIDAAFHPYWGSLLKEGNETSSFGDQVEEYACLYTSRVSNFYLYSPLQTFRSPRDVLPHEL